MLLKEYLRLALTLPPGEVARRGAALIGRNVRQRGRAMRNLVLSTYGELPKDFNASGVTLHFPSPTVEELLPYKEQVLYLATNALRHEFNLLGSGWTKLAYGMRCGGVEGHVYDMPPPAMPYEERWVERHVNRANAAESRRRFGLIPSSYEPIDWQLDFKSGFRWSASTPAHAIRYGHRPGADVKVPWELARMQHLPQLAWAYQLAAAGHTEFEAPDVYVREFEYQILDFIALNPPGYGANWACTMDVAIRASNWLMAWQFLRNTGAGFEREFLDVFIASLYDHGHFIINHLEWSPTLRSNHYLANISGLLFIAGYLPSSPRSDAWLSLAIHELEQETRAQFHGDGSNFEGSTSYHRLSGEMLLYATALIYSLPSSRLQGLPPWDASSVGHRGPGPLPPLSVAPGHSVFSVEHVHCLERIANFTRMLSFPDGTAVQFGDNDSGRFLKLEPALKAAADGDYQEDGLNHSHLPAACAGICRDSSVHDDDSSRLEFRLLRKIDCPFRLQEGKLSSRTVSPPTAFFPDFGAYTYRLPSMQLAIRCGAVGQNGNGGHAHNDQLSFSLSVHGVPFLIDTGTYLYTPVPEVRNRFRSTEMHNTLAFNGIEQNEWLEGRMGLFSLVRAATATVLWATDTSFKGECRYGGVTHTRTFDLGPTELRIVDEYTPRRATLNFHLAPGVLARMEENGRSVLLTCAGQSVRLDFEGTNLQLCESEISLGYGEKSKAGRIRYELEGTGRSCVTVHMLQEDR